MKKDRKREKIKGKEGKKKKREKRLDGKHPDIYFSF